MPKKLDLTESERRFMVEMHRFATDGEGNEILIGLNYDESVWYLNYQRVRKYEKPPPSREEGDRWLALWKRHEYYRRQTAFAVIQAKRVKNKN